MKLKNDRFIFEFDCCYTEIISALTQTRLVLVDIPVSKKGN